MTYPIPNYTRVWVRGRIIDLGKAATGAEQYGVARPIQFAPSPRVLLNVGTGQIIATGPFSVTPSATDGYFQVLLPATDDPDTTPSGFTYAVVEPTGRTYSIVVPQATPLLNSPGDPLHGQPVLDLITVVPAPAPLSGSVQLLTGRGVQALADAGDGSITVTYSDGATGTLAWPVGVTDTRGRAAALALILGGN